VGLLHALLFVVDTQKGLEKIRRKTAQAQTKEITEDYYRVSDANHSHAHHSDEQTQTTLRWLRNQVYGTFVALMALQHQVTGD
jgi:hypothetical protein